MKSGFPIFSYIAAGLLLLFCINSLSAQSTWVDALYLLNGDIIRGELMESEDPDRIRIRTLCRNEWVYDLDQVERIAREELPVERTLQESLPSSRGYFVRADMGALIGSGTNDKKNIFSLQIVNGYRFKNRIFTGIGTGIEFFEQPAIPLFADLSCQFGKKGILPFILFQAGYNLPIEDPPETYDIKYTAGGGAMWAAGLGSAVRINESNFLTISLLYRYQAFTTTHTSLWNEESVDITKIYNRLSVKIGLSFL